MTSSSKNRITDIWAAKITDLLTGEYPDLEVSWDLGLATLPDPAQVEQFIGFVIIEMFIPGNEPDTVITHRTLLPPFAPWEQVATEVRGLLSDMDARKAGTDIPEIAGARVWSTEPEPSPLPSIETESPA